MGKLLYKSIKEDENNTIHLDGDELREILNFEKQYDVKSRKNIAKIYSKICKKISEQNINVIISTISMFHSIRNWNKKNIKNYIEVYIKVTKQKSSMLIQKQYLVKNYTGILHLQQGNGVMDCFLN